MIWKLKIYENRNRIILWGILLLALALRLQQWGRFIVADEDTIFGWIRLLSEEPFPVHFYPPFFQYINYGLSLLYGPVLSFLGVISHSGELWASDAGRLIVMGAGRLVSTFFSMMQVYWIFLIGRRFFDCRVGLLAALIAALNPLLILDGHILKVDLLLAFLFTLQLYLILLYHEKRDKRTLFLLGLITGLAIAAKFQAAVELPALIVLLVLIKWRQGIWEILKNLLALAGWIMLGFFAGAPNWAVHLAGNIREAFAYVNELYFSFELYDKAGLSFPFYLKDFSDSFGPVVMLGVLGSLILLAFRFRMKDMLVWLTITSFLGILGFSGFYAHRMGLPLYSALALLAANFFIRDVIGRLEAHAGWRCWARRAWLLLLVGVLVYVGVQAVFSIKRFNLWRTASTLDRAIEFRDSHFAPGTAFVRENFSPVRPGDKGIWDLIGVETEVFRGPGAIPFASTGLLADYLLDGRGDEKKRYELRHRLEEYLPFHQIRKKRFSQWDGDITFWYHTALAKIQIEPVQKQLEMPRVFALHRLRDTVGYPSGRYEKGPGLIKTGIQPNWFADWRMIYSQAEIAAFKGVIFTDDVPKEVMIDVNGRRRVLKNCVGVVPFELTDFSAQILHHDWVYRIAVQAEQSEAWAVFEPLYTEDRLNIIDPMVLFEPMPDIAGGLDFSGYSDMEVRLYKRTGLDLRLYAYLQRVYLEPTLGEQRVFLKKGHYRLRMASSEGTLVQASGTLRIVAADIQERLDWDLNASDDIVLLVITADYAMTVWTFDSAAVKPGSIWIEPDLAGHFNRLYWAGQ